MKVFIISHGRLASKYGGGQIYVRNLVSGLVDRQHEVVYLSLEYKSVAEKQLEREKFEWGTELQLVLPDKWKKLNQQILRSNVVDELITIFKSISPDIIHAHALKDVISIAANQVKFPCIVTVHHGGIVCPAGALLNAEDEICQVPASDSVCLKCCIKQVPGWWVWYPLLMLLPLKVRLWAGKIVQSLSFIPFLTPLSLTTCVIRDKIKSIQDISQNSNLIISPSKIAAEALIRNGMPKQKIRIVPHGIPMPIKQPLSSDFGKRPLRFVYVGRINHVKGVHVMLEAFSDLHHRDYELHIVGQAVTNSEKRYMGKLQRKFGKVKAVWYGWMSHRESLDVITSCDVMILPTICLEVFGLSVAESLAVGRPIIATRCGGSEAQIRDGENGILVQPNDPTSLRQALELGIKDPSLIKVMATHTGKVNPINAHLKDLEKLYEECCQSC